MWRSVVVEPRRLRWARAACWLLVGCATGCSFMGKQMAVYSVSDCIERQCRGEQGKTHQQCMTSCQRQYAP
jgi:hypothetical protein